MDRWVDKVAVVTGASSGIGDAIARRLAKDGLKVAALARRADRLQVLEQEVKESGARGIVKGYICDVTSESDLTSTFRSIEQDLGPIAVLINNAGVLIKSNLTDLDLDGVKTLIDTNLHGVINCTKAGLASMKAHNVDEGHIVNISSVTGNWSEPPPPASLYSASKHALNIFSVGLRAQLRNEKLGIRVSTVSPGLVKTEMTEMFTGDISLGYYMLPEDIADAVSYVIAAPHHVNVSQITVDTLFEVVYARLGAM
uniref:Uncharacterized protein n=1 Tax=Riptortus pedestris TaxID=329032 RepID=R4WNA5_RIPPE|nr:hypothetical protein [Riptortus pedestris]